MHDPDQLHHHGNLKEREVGGEGLEQNLGINRKCSHSKEKKHTVLKHVKMNLTLVIKYFNFPGILARVSKGQKKIIMPTY